MSSYIIGPNYISFFYGNRPYSVTQDHPRFALIKENLLHGFISDAHEILTRANEAFEYRGLTINSNGVFYQGERLNGAVVDRIIELFKADKPVDRLVAFLRRLMDNPSKFIYNNLYNYLEKYKLPIDENGYVYAIKAVKHDLKSKWTDKVQYVVGQTYSEPRAFLTAQDNDSYCGKGLWFGWTDFVFNYGHGNDHVVVVRVDPANIIATPNLSGYQKIAASALFIVEDLGEISEAKKLFSLTSNIAENNPSLAKVVNSKPVDTKLKYKRDARGRFAKVSQFDKLFS